MNSKIIATIKNNGNLKPNDCTAEDFSYGSSHINNNSVGEYSDHLKKITLIEK